MAFNSEDLIDVLQLDHLNPQVAQEIINRKLTKLKNDREKLEDKMEQLDALEFQLTQALQKAEARDRSAKHLDILQETVPLPNGKN